MIVFSIVVEKVDSFLCSLMNRYDSALSKVEDDLIYAVARWILLILFPFACIKLGYIYAQHDKSYVTSDRIRKENIRFFDRIDPSTIVSTYGAGRIIWIFLLLSPLPDEGEKKQSRL